MSAGDEPTSPWNSLLAWSEANAEILGWLAVLSLVTFVGSLLLLPWLVARLPRDYFATPASPPSQWARHHPYVRLAGFVLRNVIGGAMFLAGLAMLVLPGQGILTLLASLVLLDFPGKRALELSLARHPRVLRALDWLRRRAGQPPLLAPPPRRRTPPQTPDDGA